MSKLERFTGDIPAFASEALSQERTVFGTELISDDINQQINSFFKRGWGMVSGSDQPSLQDFNALAFTLSQLIAYLYQRGVSEFNSDATYYEHSAVIYDGNLWLAKVDEPTDAPGEMLGEWVHLLTLEDASDRSDPDKIVKRNAEGTFDVSEPTQNKHPVRLKELEGHKNDTKAHPAANITYSNDGSGLAAEDVQSAVDEVTNRLIDVENNAYAATAATVTWNKDTDTYSGTPFATPVHKAMRRCMVLPDGTVNYYLDEFDSTLKEDGNPTVTNGDDGQVMVEIPQFYVRTIIHGSQFTWQLSDAALPGFQLHPVFEDGAVEKIFIGAYDAVVWQASSNSVIDGLNLNDNTSRVNLNNDRLYSTPGNFAMVGLTRDEFRQLARNSGYQLYDYWMWQAVQFLWITEYGNWNSQAVLGRGNVDGNYPSSSSDQAQSPHVINGLSDNFGNYSGSVASADGLPFVTYRGIENVWGNAWQFIDGVNVNNRQLYVSTNEDTFADDIDTGDYQSLGVPLPSAGNTFIKNWQALENVFVPAKVGDGASANTFIGDAIWTSTGWRTMRVGGDVDDALTCGVSCCSSGHDASYRNRVISSRLSKKLRN